MTDPFLEAIENLSRFHRAREVLRPGATTAGGRGPTPCPNHLRPGGSMDGGRPGARQRVESLRRHRRPQRGRGAPTRRRVVHGRRRPTSQDRSVCAIDPGVAPGTGSEPCDLEILGTGTTMFRPFFFNEPRALRLSGLSGTSDYLAWTAPSPPPAEPTEPDPPSPIPAPHRWPPPPPAPALPTPRRSVGSPVIRRLSGCHASRPTRPPRTGRGR